MFLIPNPLQLVIDDLGWFCGDDDRESGGASRSGMPRRHCAEDYMAIHALGKALQMKINCAFVLGEWDPDNRLRKIVHLSKYGDNWNNAAYLDPQQARRCAEVINRSEYIDIAVHGINHGYYMENVDNTDMSDYYYRINRILYMAPETEVRGRLDAFFDLLSYYGIDKPIDTMVMPCFQYRWGEISRILPDYGIRYMSNPFDSIEGDVPSVCGVDNGIITIDRANNFIPWDAPNASPDGLTIDGIGRKKDGTPAYGIMGFHWPNFLHEDPARNMEVVDRWVAYFKRCAQQFTVVASPDIRFASHQLMYLKYADVQRYDDRIIIDISSVPVETPFCVNMKCEPKAWHGCQMSVREVHPDFITYDVKPENAIIRIDL